LGSSSRGGQLALVVQLLIKYYKNIFRVKSLIIIVAIVTIGWALLPQEQKDRFTEAGQDKTSEQRLLYWKNGIDMLGDHPFVGVGYFNFIPYYERYYPEGMLYESAELPHNIFIQVSSELGWMGFIPYLALIASGMLAARAVRVTTSEAGQDALFFRLA